jgi:hypothetical protein
VFSAAKAKRARPETPGKKKKAKKKSGKSTKKKSS